MELNYMLEDRSCTTRRRMCTLISHYDRTLNLVK